MRYVRIWSATIIKKLAIDKNIEHGAHLGVPNAAAALMRWRRQPDRSASFGEGSPPFFYLMHEHVRKSAMIACDDPLYD
jgi:hypothetical protein